MTMEFEALDECSPWQVKNFSHSFRYSSDEAIAFETGYFGLIIDRKDLTSFQFKEFPLDDKITYSDCLQESHRGRMDGLLKEAFFLKLQIKNDSYRAACAIQKPRLLESGKICQRYDFRGIHFDGIQDIAATLVVLVWPDSITFEVRIKVGEKQKDPEKATPLLEGFRLTMKFQKWFVQKSFFQSEDIDKEEFSAILSCNLTENIVRLQDQEAGIKMKADTVPSQDLKSDFDPRFNCYHIRKDGHLKRTFLTGYTDIRNYDTFKVEIQNQGPTDVYVPVLLFVQPLANPTGVCPIVCDMDYVPTGIPIQLSKNWHESNVPSYGRFYTFLPVKTHSSTVYYIRCVYGFYGSLPSASHANLSLVGYHGHGTRWEQLAIGCWGETFCMDVDMGCTKRTITDIRMLMTKGVDNLSWRWSDAGWGGDWLKLFSKGARVSPFQWKCAYFSHGPCLTNVSYTGWYGEAKNVHMYANVKTPRADDYARTFTSLRYEFHENIPCSDASLFEVGTTEYICTPKITWGNAKGLVEERILWDLEPGSLYLNQMQMEGPGPWWFGFPDQRQMNERKWGKGWRAVVIRSFEACFGGTKYCNPCFSIFNEGKSGNHPNVVFMIKSPKDVDGFSEGDWVSFEAEIVTFPRNASDYYGPNNHFRTHLESINESWKTIYREATGTHDVRVEGGELSSIYPLIIIASNTDRIKFTIKGGVGAVPIQICRLPSRHYVLFQVSFGEIEIPLDQAVHSNDFWQCEYTNEYYNIDNSLGWYDISFNILLDALSESSTWVLRRKENSLEETVEIMSG